MSTKILIINSEIQKAVSEIISREIRNPKIEGIISVTKVDTTTDLSFCKIYLSIFVPNGNKDDVFNEIKHSAGFIRKELCGRVDMRKVPYLEFELDNSVEYGARIDEVINKLHEEKK